jgi:ATP synthase protein I
MVRRVMAGDQSPQPPAGGGAGQGWVAISYLIAGIAVWGFIGWLVDRRFDLGGVPIGIGAVVGAAGGIYLVVRRLGV